jgi:hypothetical protein
VAAFDCTSNAGNFERYPISFHSLSESHLEGLGSRSFTVDEGPARKKFHSSSSIKFSLLRLVEHISNDSNILSFSKRLRETLQYRRYWKKVFMVSIRLGRSLDFSDLTIAELNNARYLYKSQLKLMCYLFYFLLKLINICTIVNWYKYCIYKIKVQFT